MSSAISPQKVEQVRRAIRLDRLLETAVQLIEIPSPTRSAADVSNKLARILEDEGLEVERPDANWPDAPAVAARWPKRHLAGAGGRVLQFNGHLDTVHLPFVSPRIEDGYLYGSGASDMKGGIAAMVEAVFALRDAGALSTGEILLTAHDLHESPWGDGSQLDGLIEAGFLGDAVLLPEYLSNCLPVIGRGLAVLEVKITRPGQPIHEVLGGIDQPSVIAAGAELVRRLGDLDQQVAQLTNSLAGRESVFVGQVASGEIYNQAPIEFRLSGTRRWLPGSKIEEVKSQFENLLADVSRECGVAIDGVFHDVRDAFELDQKHPIVTAFQSAHQAASANRSMGPLPVGAKPFVDDGNAYIRQGNIPAITHGPDAKGAHTVHEQVSVSELERVALVYALTAMEFCDQTRC